MNLESYGVLWFVFGVSAGVNLESCGVSFSSLYSCARLRVLSIGVMTALSAAARRTVA